MVAHTLTLEASKTQVAISDTATANIAIHETKER
jgi:hypothetical protein